MFRLQLAAWLCLLLLLDPCYAAAVVVVEDAQVLHNRTANTAQQAAAKLGLLLPLSVRHGLHRARGRRLLKHGAVSPVLGAVREGYFYAQLSLGTPPRTFSTIIDTGSTITYIPCSRCKHCGTHMAAAFDPSKSSTARLLPCGDAQCQCGSPACSCTEQTCYYTRHYAEESSSEGWMVSDKLQFPAADSSVDVVFGCENLETGEIYKQRVDGVLGMGNNHNAFPRQLAKSGLMQDVFSLCFGFPEGGSMLLGDVTTEPQVKLDYTPFLKVPRSYYTIATQSLSLNGVDLKVNPADFAQGYGTVLDSGTTFTYLPTTAYQAFMSVLTEALKHSSLKRASGADPSYNDVCWSNAPHDWKGIDAIFPKGNITFAGDAFIELVPYRYLFMIGPGQFCLGVFDNGWQGTLLGGIITRNVLVQYDKVNERAGFGHADCNAIKQQVQEAAHAATGHSETAGGTSSQHGQPPVVPTAPHQPPATTADEQHHESKRPWAGDEENDSLSQGGAVDEEDEPQQQQPEDTGSRQQEQQQQGHKQAHEQEYEQEEQQQSFAVWKQQHLQGDAGGGPDEDGLSGMPSSSGFSKRQHVRNSANLRSVWLGVGISMVVVLAILQVGYMTFCQQQDGGKGGPVSTGGVLPRSLGGQQRSYQQVGTTEDQELVDFSDRMVHASSLQQQQQIRPT